MSWERFKKRHYHDPASGLSLDLSRMNTPDDYLERMAGPIANAYAAMEELEKGAIANPDENRMVGHYWLRTPELAPEPEIRSAIQRTLDEIETFADEVHSGALKGEGGRFRNLLIIGIGGSALGPQFVEQALGQPKKDKLRLHFFDNTDPDGIGRTLETLDGELGRTLAVVISKSGGTAETRNGMLEARRAYKDAGLAFNRYAVAVTGEDSRLDRIARDEGWLRRFPMWDWVGGRTSELGPVGLLPAALQAIDFRGLLNGAAHMDELTRNRETRQNPAALLALMWYHATGGKGEKDMILLPYKDRLQLFSRYLQQLVMESLGKELDLDGNVVNQGISVYGNKGSTDQHAYIQQLREGPINFFVTFIEVLRDRETDSMEVEPGITSGDYLHGFFLGTRKALYEKDRESMTITVPEVSPETVGMLIALYERAVGFYASLVNINAYHQPGVEAGKKAASSVLGLKKELLEKLRSSSAPRTAEELARELGEEKDCETVYKLLEHLAANADRKVSKKSGPDAFSAVYSIRN